MGIRGKKPEIISGSHNEILVVVVICFNCIVEVTPQEEEQEPRITKFNVQIKEVEKKLKTLIRSLDSLVVRTLGGAGSHCIRKFLLEVVDEFRVESKSRSRRDPFEVTVQDRLVVIRWRLQPPLQTPHLHFTGKFNLPGQFAGEFTKLSEGRGR